MTTSAAYDVNRGLPVVLDDGSRKYVWGAQGLAYAVDKASGAISVYHTDGLGNVRAISDSGANVIETYRTGTGYPCRPPAPAPSRTSTPASHATRRRRVLDRFTELLWGG